MTYYKNWVKKRSWKWYFKHPRKKQGPKHMKPYKGRKMSKTSKWTNAGHFRIRHVNKWL